MRQRSTLLTWEWFSFCPNGDLKSQNYHFPDMYLLLSHCPYAGRIILDTGKGDYGWHCFTNFNFQPLSVSLFFRVFSILQHSAPVACNEHLPLSQMRSEVIIIRPIAKKKKRVFVPTLFGLSDSSSTLAQKLCSRARDIIKGCIFSSRQIWDKLSDYRCLFNESHPSWALNEAKAL